MRFLKQSTQVDIVVGPFLSKDDGVTSDAGVSSGTTAKKVKGTTMTALTLSNWAHIGSGYYLVTLASGDTDTIGHLRLYFVNEATYLPVFEDFHVIKADAYDALFGSTGLNNIADAVLCRDMGSARGQSVFTVASRSLLNAISFLRNKWAIAGTTLTVNTEDDSATAWSATIVPTSGATPITSVDPT
jgi:hypothetical protein